MNFSFNEMKSLTLSAVKIFKVVSGRRRRPVLTFFLQTHYGLAIILGQLYIVSIVRSGKNAVFLRIKGTQRLRNIDLRGSSRGFNMSIIRSLN
jgi:hypothetical protein